MIEHDAAHQLDAPPRCRRCGAAQDTVPEGKSLCPSCNHRLRIARPPVVRGPPGLCTHHPDQPTTGVCAACGAFTCVACDVSLRGIRYCEMCQAEQALRIKVPVPWEDRRAIGWMRAWWRTTVAITTRPGEFFEQLEPRGNMGSAVLFGLLGVLAANSFAMLIMLLQTGLVTVMMGVITVAAPSQPPTGGPHPILVWVAMMAYMIGLTLAIPLGSLVGYIALTSLMHLTLRLFGAGGQHGLNATLKVACYAMGTGWTGIIPYMGQMVQPFWWTGLMVIGTAKVHDCSTTRSLSILIPMAVMCIAPVAAYILFAVVGLIVGWL